MEQFRELTRREAIRKMVGGAVAPTLLLAACDGASSAGDHSASEAESFDLIPVDLDPDGIISTYVCARPYRPSGFRLDAEPFGDGLLVHNYGHGGAGFTLSWGTAEAAADHLRDAAAPSDAHVAVLGCGVVGLSTGLVLLERGFSVTIHTREMPPNTTSNLAGASFYPSTVVDSEGLTSAFARRLEAACRASHARYLELMGDPRYGISWKPQYFVTDEWSEEIAAGSPIYRMLQDLYPDPALYGEGEHPFKTRFAYREDNLFIEPAGYLSRLVADFRARGGQIEVRSFGSMDDVAALGERWVVNCTGLGATALVPDDEVRANPSQTVILAPQPGIDYAVTGIDGAYMFPRSDGIMLGRGEGVVDPGELLRQQEALLVRAP